MKQQEERFEKVKEGHYPIFLGFSVLVLILFWSSIMVSFTNPMLGLENISQGLRVFLAIFLFILNLYLCSLFTVIISSYKVYWRKIK